MVQFPAAANDQDDSSCKLPRWQQLQMTKMTAAANDQDDRSCKLGQQQKESPQLVYTDKTTIQIEYKS